jgi:hypothetical protein
MNTIRLKEIHDILLNARSHPQYQIGSPDAIDHLLVHVVGIIQALLDEAPYEPITNPDSTPPTTPE